MDEMNKILESSCDISHLNHLIDLCSETLPDNFTDGDEIKSDVFQMILYYYFKLCNSITKHIVQTEMQSILDIMEDLPSDNTIITQGLNTPDAFKKNYQSSFTEVKKYFKSVLYLFHHIKTIAQYEQVFTDAIVNYYRMNGYSDEQLNKYIFDGLISEENNTR